MDNARDEIKSLRFHNPLSNDENELCKYVIKN